MVKTDQKFVQGIKEVLTVKRDKFNKDLEELLNTPINVDLEKAGRDAFLSAQEKKDKKEHELRENIRTVESTLKEIGEGKFGICINCHKKIPLWRFGKGSPGIFITPNCVLLAGKKKITIRNRSKLF